MDAVKVIACPGCGCNHTVSIDALDGRDMDSLDLCCDSCAEDYDAHFESEYADFDEEPWDGFRDDVDADADALRMAGWGTDEDYGCYDSGLDYDFDMYGEW